MQPDTIIPDLSNPQGWNRYSYVLNNPIHYNDPNGHCATDGDDWCYSTSNSTVPVSTNTPTSTPTATPSPTSTLTPLPTPTGIPSSIENAITYIQDSSLGKSRYDLMIAEGYSVDYSGSVYGHLDTNLKKILVPNTASPVYIAGTIAHESMHYKAGRGSLYQEYVAYLVGSMVMTEIVQARHGSKSDISIPLSDFTVDIENPNRKALAKDLRSWFYSNGLGIYPDPKSKNGYGLPAFPYARDLDRDR